jgi:hypothetical protein
MIILTNDLSNYGTKFPLCKSLIIIQIFLTSDSLVKLYYSPRNLSNVTIIFTVFNNSNRR